MTAAAQWYRKAADQGRPEAQYNLGRLFDQGLIPGLGSDFAEAVKWYAKAAASGNAMAQYNLGLMHHSGRGVDAPSDAAAFHWWTLAAAQGDGDAMTSLGTLHRLGIAPGPAASAASAAAPAHTPRPPSPANSTTATVRSPSPGGGRGGSGSGDFGLAAAWYAKAAEAGDPTAMALLGCLHRFGKVDPGTFTAHPASSNDDDHGLPPLASPGAGAGAAGSSPGDPEEAMAAAAGRHPQHLVNAAAWFAKAAEFGHPGAEGSLAVLSLQGLGTPRSAKVAWRWLRKAARDCDGGGASGGSSGGGSGAGQFGLPELFYPTPAALEADLTKCRQLCQTAAVQGNGQAQMLLRTQFPS